jgi:hypothetical protein
MDEMAALSDGQWDRGRKPLLREVLQIPTATPQEIPMDAMTGAISLTERLIVGWNERRRSVYPTDSATEFCAWLTKILAEIPGRDLEKATMLINPIPGDSGFMVGVRYPHQEK